MIHKISYTLFTSERILARKSSTVGQQPAWYIDQMGEVWLGDKRTVGAPTASVPAAGVPAAGISFPPHIPT